MSTPPDTARSNVAQPPSAVGGGAFGVHALACVGGGGNDPPLSNQQQAQSVAIHQAVAALAGVDWSYRAPALGLTLLPDGSLELPFLGRPVRITLPGCGGGGSSSPSCPSMFNSAQPVKLTDRLLIAHYLNCSTPIVPTSTLISFRDLPGGQFYYQPFCSRTTDPLVKRIGNNLDLLRANLTRIPHTPLDIPDLSVRVQAVGNLPVTLIYRAGDPDDPAIPPTAEILFDAVIKRIYGAEDAAALASRVCLALL